LPSPSTSCSSIGLAGGFEADAIRPNVLGRFEDLLLAAVRHPAMLLYLDQAQSTGPNSRLGRRANGQGLNENLAREILELHTLGVRSGYTQEDVTEFARALTGWTLPGEDVLDGAPATFRFVAAMHEPGQRTLLGRNYPDDGEHRRAPSCTTWQRRRRRRATSPPSWRATSSPTIRRRRWCSAWPTLSCAAAATCPRVPRTGGGAGNVGGGRGQVQVAMGLDHFEPARAGPARDRTCPARHLMTQLGQPVWRPGSPAGFGDTAAAWAAPDALAAAGGSGAAPGRPGRATRSMRAHWRRACCPARWASAPPAIALPKAGHRACAAAGFARIPEEIKWSVDESFFAARPRCWPRRLVFAQAATERRFVFIIQRGAADGLNTVIPYADPAYARLRGALAIDPAAALKLDGTFALHPALTELASCTRPARPVFSMRWPRPTATAPTSMGRTCWKPAAARPTQLKDGWMNRLLGMLPRRGKDAIALRADGARWPCAAQSRCRRTRRRRCPSRTKT
jgi:hypothetical protein